MKNQENYKGTLGFVSYCNDMKIWIWYLVLIIVCVPWLYHSLVFFFFQVNSYLKSVTASTWENTNIKKFLHHASHPLMLRIGASIPLSDSKQIRLEGARSDVSWSLHVEFDLDNRSPGRTWESKVQRWYQRWWLTRKHMSSTNRGVLFFYFFYSVCSL